MTEATSDERTAKNEHETLKYSLLGPSLTKAGQDTVDQKKVRLLIHPSGLRVLTWM